MPTRLTLILGLFQVARRRRSRGLTATLRHLGAIGLFFVAILDSTPLPTFGGADILTAILAAAHRNPWYEYAAVAAAGSTIGAYITFRIARGAGIAYLNSKFGQGKVAKLLNVFQEWGGGILALSTAVPFPFPTSLLFCAAGASNYSTRKFVTIVVACRGLRYAVIAILADQYGRRFVRLFRHPQQYWGWLLLFALIMAGVIATAIAINRRLVAAASAEEVRRGAGPVNA